MVLSFTFSFSFLLFTSPLLSLSQMLSLSRWLFLTHPRRRIESALATFPYLLSATGTHAPKVLVLRKDRSSIRYAKRGRKMECSSVWNCPFAIIFALLLFQAAELAEKDWLPYSCPMEFFLLFRHFAKRDFVSNISHQKCFAFGGISH